MECDTDDCPGVSVFIRTVQNSGHFTCVFVEMRATQVSADVLNVVRAKNARTGENKNAQFVFSA